MARAEIYQLFEIDSTNPISIISSLSSDTTVPPISHHRDLRTGRRHSYRPVGSNRRWNQLLGMSETHFNISASWHPPDDTPPRQPQLVTTSPPSHSFRGPPRSSTTSRSSRTHYCQQYYMHHTTTGARSLALCFLASEPTVKSIQGGEGGVSPPSAPRLPEGKI